eukprot:gene8444-10372_t
MNRPSPDDFKVLSYFKDSKVLEFLYIEIDQNQPKIFIPESVNTLRLYPIQNARFIFEKGVIPSTLTILIISYSLYKDNLKVIPDELQELVVFNWNNSKTDDDEATVSECMFPPKIRKLKISGEGCYFRIGSFPTSITELRMDVSIDSPLLPGLLPDSINPVFGKSFMLPNPDESKKVSYTKDIFPSTLVKLQCSGLYVENFASSSIRHLEIGNLRVSHLTTLPQIPASCKTLHYYSPNREPKYIPVGWIPATCKHLVLQGRFQQFNQQSFENGVLPSGLKSLSLSTYLTMSKCGTFITFIPNTIKYLYLSSDFNDKESLDQYSQLFSNLFNDSNNPLIHLFTTPFKINHN